MPASRRLPCPFRPHVKRAKRAQTHANGWETKISPEVVLGLLGVAIPVVALYVRRHLYHLRELAGPTVCEIDEAGRYLHRYTKGVKPLFAASLKAKRR